MFYRVIWSPASYQDIELFELFSEALWFHFFKEPIDSRPGPSDKILEQIRGRFFGYEWFEVYDFLEFVVGHYQTSATARLAEYLNLILERELSGYRFVSGLLTDITSAQELEMLETALTDSQFPGVDAHLQQALELYANRKNPDYRNSIKESISAVESMARIVSEKPKATLHDALKAIEKKGLLHPGTEGWLHQALRIHERRGRHPSRDARRTKSHRGGRSLLSTLMYIVHKLSKGQDRLTQHLTSGSTWNRGRTVLSYQHDN